MAFEVAEKGTTVGQGNVEPLVSIRKSETVGINKPAVEEMDEDVEYVRLSQDEDNPDIVAIIPAEEDHENSYTLSISEQGSATVGCSTVLKDYGLVFDQTKRYEPEVKDVETTDGETVENALVIDVSEVHSTYGSPDSDEDE